MLIGDRMTLIGCISQHAARPEEESVNAITRPRVCVFCSYLALAVDA